MLPGDTYPEPVHLAVIGGTGISHLEHEGFVAVASLETMTPWGTTSSPITILKTPHSKKPIAFLARHGPSHDIAPSEVPSRANIAALRSIGVRSIMAFSAVGSLQESIAPRDFIVPDQIIDRTKGVRPATFFEHGLVGHVAFADPFDKGLSDVFREVGEKVCAERGVKMHKEGILVCMEGPQFSTRAESNLYRSWGGSVINMSALPEAKLAREAEIAYSMICMSTDYDCWKVGEEPVTVETVMGNMRANSETAKHLVGEVLKELVSDENEEKYGALVRGKHLEGSTKFAVVTAKEARGKEVMANLEWLLSCRLD